MELIGDFFLHIFKAGGVAILFAFVAGAGTYGLTRLRGERSPGDGQADGYLVIIVGVVALIVTFISMLIWG